MVSTSCIRLLAQCATRCALSFGLSPFCKSSSWVVIPVGQVFLLHCNACTQPNANIKPRAELTQSAPRQSAAATPPGLIILPEQITRMRWRRPCCCNLPTTRSRLHRTGRPMKSIRLWGAAPVPPSALSTVKNRVRNPILAHVYARSPLPGEKATARQNSLRIY